MTAKWVKLAAAAALMVGCAASPQPFDYHDDRDEKPGPGLFSGEEGGYVITGGPSEQEADTDKAPADKE
jgi:hypothetical protein